MSRFVDLVASGVPVLTDGGIETRIMFETSIEMDPDVQSASLVSDPDGREALRRIHLEYIEAARAFDLPVILGTPTFRGGARYAAKARGRVKDIEGLNRDAVEFMLEVRDRAGYEPVYIAGDIGPSGDAYLPEQALAGEEAVQYHRAQAEALAGAGVDFLYAPTFPSVAEAEAACVAMAATGLPHVISYVLGPDGRVLDGTSIAEAIARIDSNPGARPLFHSLSCVHPVAAGKAIAAFRAEAPGLTDRLVEFKANGSPLRTDELVKLDHPAGDDPEPFADEMIELFDPHGLRILGGCCGTRETHMRALAARLAARR